MNVSLTAELEKYVRRRVASGLYSNARSDPGSTARPDSDIDVLVDIVTRRGLEPAIRDRVFREAEAVF
jgi:predicted nucleotidyltransferase